MPASTCTFLAAVIYAKLSMHGLYDMIIYFSMIMLAKPIYLTKPNITDQSFIAVML